MWTKITGNLHARGTRFLADLDLGKLDMQEHAALTSPEDRDSSAPTPRSRVDLSNASIGRDLYMKGAHVTGRVDLSGVTVGGSIYLDAGTNITKLLTLERSYIQDNVMLGQGTFQSIDLTSITINRELRLESDGNGPTWQRFDKQGNRAPPQPYYPKCPDGDKNLDPDPGPSRLELRNARVDLVRHTLHSWPDCLSLRGFTYRLPPHDYSSNDKQADEIWWINWLERDPNRDQQTYKQLATALANRAEIDQADAIRYEKRVFEQEHATGWVLRIMLFLERYTVGFGIGTYAALRGSISVLVLASVGTVALLWRMRITGVPDAIPTRTWKRFFWCFGASLQCAIPFVTFSTQFESSLNKPPSDNKSTSGKEPAILQGRYLFLFSTISLLGWVLGAFMLHGFANFMEP